MTKNDSREHSQAVASGVKSWMETVHALCRHLEALDKSLPDLLRDVPASELQEMAEELRAALITWSSEIDPVQRSLRAVLRKIAEASWEYRLIEPRNGGSTIGWTGK
jgi:hypothetical protein